MGREALNSKHASVAEARIKEMWLEPEGMAIALGAYGGNIRRKQTVSGKQTRLATSTQSGN